MWFDWAAARENCVLLCAGSQFLDERGLAYSCDGDVPAPGGRLSVHHLFGKWYVFQLHDF
jgi:hypothetical protein